jgi:hypothetical protein
VSPEEHQQLQEATRDLGFGRALSEPPAKVEPPPATVRIDPPAPRLKARTTSVKPEIAPVQKRAPALKFDVPDEVWDELRMTALKRRVTVKFLVLEALAAKGYDIDLDAIPEDGRRNR